MLRVGVLGCGEFARMHVRILQSLPEQVELAAFCDRNDWKAQSFVQEYAPRQAAAYTSHAAMYDRARLDMVVICLPPYGHTDEVALAAQHGIHLLIEKPIALQSEQAWQMVEAAEAAQIKTQVGFMLRFGEAVEQLKTLLDSGAAGAPGLMSARYFCNALHAPWWRMRDKSGGQVLEQAIHLFDLMRYLMGDAVTVYSRQENLFHQQTPDYTIEDVSASVVSFRSGALGVVYATNNAIPGRWIHDYRLVTEKLTVDFASVNHATLHYTGDPEKSPQTIQSERDFRLHQTLDLIDAIQNNGSTRTPIREGAKSLDLVLGALRSNSLRAEVRL